MLHVTMLHATCLIQLLDDLADGKDYASLKREAEDRSVWKIRQ